MESEAMMRILTKIRSCDGAVVDVPEASAALSRLIRHALEDVDGAEHPIPLPFAAASTAVLAADDEKKIKDWDKQFVDALSMDALYDLVHASNYLAIEESMDLCCERVAGMIIRGKSAEEVRATFDIVNDIPPDREN